MDDLISRAAARDVINTWGRHEGEDVRMDLLHNDLNAISAVDAVPVVHARWRELKDGTEECTNCLGLCPHEENYNGDIIFNFDCEYCPWCGAKMDDERRDEDAAD